MIALPSREPPVPTPTADEIAATIAATAADGVASATTDGQSATALPVKDLIKAHQFTAAQQAVSGTNPNGGARSLWTRLRPARVVPPGAC